jgi:hypothetical protein
MEMPPPIKVLDVELARELPAIPPTAYAMSYRSARALVRLHGWPIGTVDLPLDATGSSAEDCARRIWSGLRQEISEHLAQDGLACPPELTAQGLTQQPELPRCGAGRRAASAAAEPISVVIATRDRADSLARCLRSLRALVHPNFEVIVVDNAPATAATHDLVLQHHPEVRYVREDRPGVAAARNRALSEVTSSVVAFTDDDVTVDPLWLLELAAGFAGDARVACVTGLVVAAELDTPAQMWADHHWTFCKGFREEVFHEPLRRLSTRPYPYTAGTFGSGNNMAFRTSVLRQIGGFDPLIGTGTPARGGEDLAMFFSVIAGGHALRYRPAAVARHWHARDVEALRRQAFGYGAGLTAYLAKVLADDPARVLDVAARAPRALAHAHTLALRRGTADGRPADLVRLERRGMVHGTIAYLRSRRRAAAEGRR